MKLKINQLYKIMISHNMFYIGFYSGKHNISNEWYHVFDTGNPYPKDASGELYFTDENIKKLTFEELQ